MEQVHGGCGTGADLEIQISAGSAEVTRIQSSGTIRRFLSPPALLGCEHVTHYCYVVIILETCYEFVLNPVLYSYHIFHTRGHSAANGCSSFELS